jgi:superfamily II DNA/RNA helicase
MTQYPADVIGQAKSGTGKTCVFAVALLENVDVTVPGVQVRERVCLGTDVVTGN